MRDNSQRERSSWCLWRFHHEHKIGGVIKRRCLACTACIRGNGILHPCQRRLNVRSTLPGTLSMIFFALFVKINRITASGKKHRWTYTRAVCCVLCSIPNVLIHESGTYILCSAVTRISKCTNQSRALLHPEFFNTRVKTGRPVLFCSPSFLKHELEKTQIMTIKLDKRKPDTDKSERYDRSLYHQTEYHRNILGVRLHPGAFPFSRAHSHNLYLFSFVSWLDSSHLYFQESEKSLLFPAEKERITSRNNGEIRDNES